MKAKVYKEKKNTLIAKCDNEVSKLFDKRKSIIMAYRKQYGTDNACTDDQWNAYLKAIEPHKNEITEMGNDIKKAYITFNRKLQNLESAYLRKVTKP